MVTFNIIHVAYATGLLVARRALTKLGLADKYEGVTEPDGTISLIEALDDEDAPRPFKCYLDVGLKRTSTGSRVFGALKGASDGGIHIPHNEKRFPGYDPESKEIDEEVLKKYIFGGHVAEYMESLEEEDDERYACCYEYESRLIKLHDPGSRSNFQLTLPTVLAPRTWKKSIPMPTLLSVKIPPSSRQKSLRTGRQRPSSSRHPASPSSSAEPTFRQELRPSRPVEMRSWRTRMKIRCLVSSLR